MGENNMRQGTIFDIKEFAVFDGPGMRQTVFFKGCPLRCSWCHNPEGLSGLPQLMVSTASCLHCGKCAEACPQKAEGAGHNAGTASCIACGKCIPVCPLNLRKIAGERMNSEALVQKIRKDSDFYARYGGGVTFSGGEPLMQADFLMEVLEQLPDIHRAIETSGYCDPEKFRQVLANLDYVMMDIKLFDRDRHRHYTGVDNTNILKNARTLCEGDTPFVIRIPVIPGVNDTDENYQATAEFLTGAKALQKVEFLPYHKTAGAKYTMVGKDYRPDFDPEQGVHINRKIFEDLGIATEVL